MVSAQVIGNDAAIVFGGAAGNFELNVMLPMLHATSGGRSGCMTNVRPPVRGPDASGITRNLERTLSVRRELSLHRHAPERYIAYEEAAKVANRALAKPDDPQVSLSAATATRAS